MPNAANIDAPIVLVSPGRSGTTLLSAVFDGHPDCSSCGETIDLIFDLWNSAQRSLSHLTPDLDAASLAPAQDRIAQFVRGGFLLLLNDGKRHWFQKPIGIPAAFSPYLFDDAAWDDRARQYWHVMRCTFPRGRFFTVLRHPCDTVISYKNRFDVDERTSWAMLGFLAHILQHEDSAVGHAVPFDALVDDREAALRGLLSFVGLPYRSEMLDAFNTLHTQSERRGSSHGSDFSWKNRWHELDPQFAEARFVDPIRRLYAKFGRELDLPLACERVIASSAAVVPSAEAASREAEAMRHYIVDLEQRVANAHVLWEERAIRMENNFNESYLRLEAQMQELTALRMNPFVRFLNKTGLLSLGSRLWNALS
jgi:hypothetical protein